MCAPVFRKVRYIVPVLPHTTTEKTQDAFVRAHLRVRPFSNLITYPRQPARDQPRERGLGFLSRMLKAPGGSHRVYLWTVALRLRRCNTVAQGTLRLFENRPAQLGDFAVDARFLILHQHNAVVCSTSTANHACSMNSPTLCGMPLKVANAPTYSRNAMRSMLHTSQRRLCGQSAAAPVRKVALQTYLRPL